MDATSKLDLPSLPTFSQMMEDLEIMSSDEKTFHIESLVEAANEARSVSVGDDASVEQTHGLIGEFLSGLATLQRLDTSLTTQNDSINDQLERKLKTILEQLQLCLTKLQSNSFSAAKPARSDNK